MTARKYTFIVEIRGDIDSNKLYKSIKQYNMNVLDDKECVYVYNFTYMPSNTIVKVLQECCKFGKCTIVAIDSVK